MLRNKWYEMVGYGDVTYRFSGKYFLEAMEMIGVMPRKVRNFLKCEYTWDDTDSLRDIYYNHGWKCEIAKQDFRKEKIMIMGKILRLSELTKSEQQKVFDDNYLDEYEFAALEDAFDAKVQKNNAGIYLIYLNLAGIDFMLDYTKPYYSLKDQYDFMLNYTKSYYSLKDQYDLSQTIYNEHKDEIEDLSLTAKQNLFDDLCNLIKEYNFDYDDANVESFDCLVSCRIQDLSDLYDVLVNVISIKGEFEQLLKKYANNAGQ